MTSSPVMRGCSNAWSEIYGIACAVGDQKRLPPHPPYPRFGGDFLEWGRARVRSVVEAGEVVGDLLGGDEAVGDRLERPVGIDAGLQQ